MKEIEPEQFYIVGNNLAIDFVNSVTVDMKVVDFLGWIVAAKLVTVAEAEGLSKNWEKKTIEPVLEFRRILREETVELSAQKLPSEKIVNAINKVLIGGNRSPQLRRLDDGFIKEYKINLSEPEDILVPIAESFADILCYGDVSLLRKCENPTCLLYFYDTTKNHRRRWCSMAVCGNRAKAAKFYEKKKLKE